MTLTPKARQPISASLLTLLVHPVLFALLSIPLLSYCDVRMLRRYGSY